MPKLFLILVLVILTSLTAFHAQAAEATRIVVSRWDWAAAKFDQDAEKDLDRGDLQSASRNVAEALRRAPNFWPALYTRARLLARESKWDAALRDCNEVLHQYSAYVPAAVLRAQINAYIGNYSAARSEFDHLIEIQPRKEFYAMAYEARAWFRATCANASFRNAQGAVDDAKKACTITQWKECYPLDTLAIAYAAAGDFDSALRYEQQALKAYDASSMSKTLREHLGLFQQHRSASSR